MARLRAQPDRGAGARARHGRLPAVHRCRRGAARAGRIRVARADGRRLFPARRIRGHRLQPLRARLYTARVALGRRAARVPDLDARSAEGAPRLAADRGLARRCARPRSRHLPQGRRGPGEGAAGRARQCALRVLPRANLARCGRAAQGARGLPPARGHAGLGRGDVDGAVRDRADERGPARAHRRDPGGVPCRLPVPATPRRAALPARAVSSGARRVRSGVSVRAPGCGDPAPRRSSVRRRRRLPLAQP